jgi:Polyketide cyclase / dehydrase and lipid transport
MATVVIEIATRAAPAAAWDAVRDVGALHTRLVPGFVTATELEPGGRHVTFANGVKVFEPIISLDDDTRRLAWTAIGGPAAIKHYNSVVQVFPRKIGGSRLVWTADILPNEAAIVIGAMMEQGAIAMTAALDRLADVQRA